MYCIQKGHTSHIHDSEKGNIWCRSVGFIILEGPQWDNKGMVI